MDGEKLLNQIVFSYKEADGQKDLFTPRHVLYECAIETDLDEEKFLYQCNPIYNKPNLKDVLHCLFLDMQAFVGIDDLADFLEEFGYCGSAKDIRKGIKAYDGCRETKYKLERLFTEEELSALEEYYEDY